MIFKFLNVLTIFIIAFFFSFSQKENKIFFNDYYIIENNNDLQELMYLKEYDDYKDILYTKVVFD